MFTYTSMMFLMFVNTVAFCFFVTNTWIHGGLIYIIGTVASTIGITLLLASQPEEE